FGVGVRELADRRGERGAVADVGGDTCRVAAAGVGLGQGLRAGCGELGQVRGDFVAVGDDLHVPELAHVEVELADAGPAGEQVGRRLDEVLADDDALAVVRV